MLATGMLVSAGLFAFAACGDDSESTPGGANGEACDHGDDCESTLCFIAVAGGQGECRAMPDSCSADLACDSDCLDAMKDECTGPGASCLKMAGAFTIECLEGSSNDGGGGGVGGGGGGGV